MIFTRDKERPPTLGFTSPLHCRMKTRPRGISSRMTRLDHSPLHSVRDGIARLMLIRIETGDLFHFLECSCSLRLCEKYIR